jgi:hypothetical protein
MREPSLRDVCAGAIIVAHREETSALAATLQGEGFSVDEVRGPYPDAAGAYSLISRALINHANAWRIAATRPQPTVVFEADFVPVRDLGSLPSPIPEERADTAIGYLYSVGPQVWDLFPNGAGRGHGGGCVAMMIPPTVAALLLEFFKEEIAGNPAGTFSVWDSRLGYWLKARGVESVIPYRHYGEHGGLANPEHARHRSGRNHQADVLIGPLAFLPQYARGSRTRFRIMRFRAFLWGLLRLATGRLIAVRDARRFGWKPMIRFGVCRFFWPPRPLSRAK